MSDPLNWLVVLIAPVIIVALRWGMRNRSRGSDNSQEE
jgi:hypothetical protein